MEIKSGIYKILNKVTGKFYIGSTINFKDREYSHFRKLLTGTHANILLQSSYNKHGATSFEFIIIERVEDLGNLLKREQYYLDLYKPYSKGVGYNLCITAGSHLGLPNKYKGVPRPKFAEKFKGAGNPFYGKTHTLENLKNQSEKQKGEKNHFFGKTHSEEFRKKSSIIHKGKTLSPETRKKLSDVRKGRKKSPEHIAKIIASRLATVYKKKLLMNVTDAVEI